MKKRIAAIVAAAMLLLALPTVALAAPSISGGNTGTASSNGTTITVKAGSGSGELIVTPSTTQVSNADTTNAQLVVNYDVTKTGDLEAPYSFSLYVGTQYAGYVCKVYVHHESGALETITRVVDSNGYISFTTNELSTYTVVVTNELASTSSSASTSSTSASTATKSPQTGLDTNLVLAGTVFALVAAAGVGVALRKQISK